MAAALIGTVFEEVDAETAFRCAQEVLGFDAEAAQIGHAGIGEGVFWQSGHESRIDAQIGQ